MARIILRESMPLDEDLYFNVAQHILKTFDPDIVGLPCIVTLEIAAIGLLKAFKRLRPHCLSVLGNINASIMDQAYLAHFPEVDVIVRGEGELTCLELCNAVSHGREICHIKGLSYRAGDKVFHNRSREPMADLDELPRIDYDLLENGIAAYANADGICEAVLPVGRGCGYCCTFCSTPRFWGRRVRYFSPGRILGDIEQLIGMGVHHLHFDIDNFGAQREHALKLCQGIAAENLTVSWTARCRLDCLDQPLLNAMKTAGCSTILVGIETGDEAVLKKLKKKIPLDRSLEMVALIAESGIGAICSFVTGLPDDTLESLQRTLNLAARCASIGGSCQSGIHLVSPLPGTELSRETMRCGALELNENSLIAPDFSRYLEWVAGKRFQQDQNLIQEHEDVFSAYYCIRNVQLKHEYAAFLASYCNWLLAVFPRTAERFSRLSLQRGNFMISDMIAWHETRGIPLAELLQLGDDVPFEKVEDLFQKCEEALGQYVETMDDGALVELFRYERLQLNASRSCVPCAGEQPLLRASSMLVTNYVSDFFQHDMQKLLIEGPNEGLPPREGLPTRVLATVRLASSGRQVDTMHIDEAAWDLFSLIDGRSAFEDICRRYRERFGKTPVDFERQAAAALEACSGYVLWTEGRRDV